MWRYSKCTPLALYLYLASFSSIHAIQIGGVGSVYGALGTWTTVIHDEDDPVGQYLFEYMNTLKCLLGLTELGPTWIRKYT